MKDIKIPLAIITLNPMIAALDLLGLTVVLEFRVLLSILSVASIFWMWLIIASEEKE